MGRIEDLNAGAGVPALSARDLLLDDLRPKAEPTVERKVWQNPDGSVKWDQANAVAKTFLEERADDPKRQLSAPERAIMKTLGKALLSDDVAGVQDLLQSYQANPNDLQRALWALSKDFATGGVVLDYSTSNQAGGKPEGILRIHSDNSNSYIQLSTDPEHKPSLRGPVISLNDRLADQYKDLERRGDYYYGSKPYSGIISFGTERSAFALRTFERLYSTPTSV